MRTKKVMFTVGEAQRVSGLLQVPPQAFACYVVAHGAGAGMTHPFLANVAEELAEPRGPDQGQSSAVRMGEFLSQSECPLAPVEGTVGKAQKPPSECCI